MNTLQDIHVLFESRAAQTVMIYRTGVRRFAYSYADLARLSRQCAAWLKAQDIGKGDRVVIWSPNSPWWAVAFWGCVLRGAVVVPVDFMSGKGRAESIASHSGAKLILQSRYKLDPLERGNAANIEDIQYAIAQRATAPAAFRRSAFLRTSLTVVSGLWRRHGRCVDYTATLR